MFKHKEHRQSSIKKRAILVFGICISSWIMIATIFLNNYIKTMEENRAEKIMQSELGKISTQLDAGYLMMLQISQQMTPQGIIGGAVNRYLYATDAYDRIELSERITSDLNALVFGHDEISFLGYFETKGTQIVDTMFCNLPLRENTDPQIFTSIHTTQALRMQGIHSALNILSNEVAVSVIRPVNIANGDYTIYIELQVNDILNPETMNIEGKPYYFVQLDNNHKVVHSNTPKVGYGKKLKDISNTDYAGTYGEFRYVMQESNYGGKYLLLFPTESYLQNISYLYWGIAMVVTLAVLLVGANIFFLRRMITKPIAQFSTSIQHFSKDGFIDTLPSIGVEEFDTAIDELNSMRKKITQLIAQARKQEKEKQQLEIDKLYYQINPHFLMNTLNSIHWMALANKQPDIDDFVQQLNYILSYSLGKTHKKATLRTEVKALDLYLKMQQRRYDFNIHLQVEEGHYLDYDCARLMLQPIAENAVCHNINEFGNIWVDIAPFNHNMVKIIIRDDGHGFFQNKSDDTSDILQNSQQNKGIGLKYVVMALESFYGEAASMTIESQPNIGTCVTILVPLKKEDE